MMINLTGKSVFVKTQEEYENILNIARLHGFDKWSDKVSLSSRNIKLPNILIFKDNGTVAYWSDKGVLEVSEIIEDGEEITDAVKLVRTFAKNPSRTALTDSFIESLKLLADIVESQMKEVKQKERLTLDDAIKYTKDVARKNRINKEKNTIIIPNSFISSNDCADKYGQVAKWLEELKSYKDLEERGLLVRLPCKVGDTVWVVTSPINVFGYDEYDGDAEYEVYESFLSSVSYYASGEQFRIYAKVTNSFITAYFRECDFGESIFLTREDAEKKLEEMKNGL